MASKNDREERVVEFGLTALGAAGGPVIRLDGLRPDVAERNAPAVDFRGHDDESCVWWIEHTMLESFEEQTRRDVEFFRLFGPLRELVTGLPDGSIHLVIDPLPRLPARETERRAVLEAAARAINRTAPSIEVDPRGERHYPVTLEPPDAPFRMTVWREPGWPGPSPGELRFRSLVDMNDRPAAQRVAVDNMVAKKLPKLAAAGAATVLIVESNDIQLGSPWLTARTLQEAAVGFGLPVHVVLVIAIPKDVHELVTAYVLRRDGRWLLDSGLGMYSG